MQAAIEATRHKVEPDGTGYQARNPEQNLDLRFNAAAATIRLPDAEVRLRLAGLGRGSELALPRAATVTATKNRVEYRRGPLTEWYVNDRRGLEQGFTFANRPLGDGNLVVALTVDGGLTPRLEGTDAVVLERGGAAVLRYGGLKAWDARGKALAARMEVHGSDVRISMDDSAAAYPVTIDPWIQQAKLTASDGAANDSFGYSVALSGDTALVGAPAEATETGAAYVYLRSGTVWTEQAKLTASDRALNDRFGWSVALIGDTALVGAYQKANVTGAAYVYVRSGTAWTEQAKLTASDSAQRDYFGDSVALSGDTALVGASGKATQAGAAYVYVRSGTAWTEQAKLTASDGTQFDNFGSSVALSGDTALVGAAAKATLTGAAYVYVRSGTAWTEQTKLTAADGAPNDIFGDSVALSGDTALVGADQ
ncbi:MAG: FG-GAP repeat protein, partial [Bryobacteraceae bacterium]